MKNLLTGNYIKDFIISVTNCWVVTLCVLQSMQDILTGKTTENRTIYFSGDYLLTSNEITEVD